MTLLFVAPLTAQPTTQPAESDFLRRVEDRALREAYQNRFHVVVRDEDFQRPATSQPSIVESLAASHPKANTPNTSTDLDTPLTPIMIAAAAIALLLAILAVARKKRSSKPSLRSAEQDLSRERTTNRKRKRPVK